MQWTPYQIAWFRDKSTQKCYLKSRRVGISEALAFEIGCAAIGVDFFSGLVKRVKPVPQAIVSASQEQSRDLLAKVMTHVKALSMAAPGDVVVKDNVFEAVLANGIRIRAFSANPRSIRGFEGDVNWDECAATARPYEVWNALGPLADSNLRNPKGYKKRVVFTPEGDANFAYDIFEGRLSDEWSKHKTTIHDAVADGFPIDVEKLRRKVGDPDMFAQEYECTFLAASMRYISAELYDSCIYYDLPNPEGRHVMRYAGYDVARHRDLIAAVEGFEHNDSLWVDRVGRERDMAWDDQEAWLEEIMGRVGRCHADATGMGDQFCERATNKYGSRFEGIQFTLQNKARLATGLKLAMERKSKHGGTFLRLPNDPDLRSSVLAIRRDVTQHGNVTYGAPREPKKHGHADEAWATALMIDAAGGVATTPLTGGGKSSTGGSRRTRVFNGRARRPI